METIKKKKAFKMPHGYVVIFAILLFVSFMTYLIPAGEYLRETNAAGQEVVIPDSFGFIDKTPVPFWEIPNYIMKSFTKQADIIFGILIVGAGLEVLLSTGMFHAFCNRLSKACSGKEKWFIPLFLLLFASIGITQSTNKFIGFTPLGVMLAATLGYDAIMGVAIVMLGIGIGFSSGIFAATTAVAQGLVGLPAYSGISMRIVAFIVLYIITVFYLICYGERCKKDPTKSAIYGVPDIKQFDVNDMDTKVEKRHYLVLIVFLASFAVLIYGCLKFGWTLQQNAIIFMWMGILSGLVYGFSPSKIASEFVRGAKGMISAALIVGLGAACTLIMDEANILDTVVMGMTLTMDYLPTLLKAPAMLIINMVASVFVTSGTGQAAVVMPILAPVADLSDISRQILVLSYRLGDGICGYVQPHGGSLMPFIAAAAIPYDRWMKFFGKLWGFWVGAACLIMVFCQIIGY
ncbi:MAG: YfcC family protein [Enterocloster sp.]|uniref:YfcC family protein n=1 Tax=Enterocloster bolteae TaxID=208479 RepID=A0A6N2WHB6_9FIRM